MENHSYASICCSIGKISNSFIIFASLMIDDACEVYDYILSACICIITFPLHESL